jgi:luciferase family oxidoreductase group 1
VTRATPEFAFAPGESATMIREATARFADERIAPLAAHLGLPYAFASHFAPTHLDRAIEVYRSNFRASEQLDKPHLMAAMTVIAADTDEQAAVLASSLDQSFVDFRTGRGGRLRPPVPGFRDTLPPEARAMLEHMRQVSAVGGPATVREDMLRFVERTQADELIIAGAAWDPEARRRSLALVMDAWR